MNSVEVYQHPFVDAFKATKLTEWSLGAKKGDVTSTFDSRLAKTVIHIGETGKDSSIEVPSLLNLRKHFILGWTGKFVSFIISQ